MKQKFHIKGSDILTIDKTFLPAISPQAISWTLTDPA